MYAPHASVFRLRSAHSVRAAAPLLALLVILGGSIWLTVAFGARDGRFGGEAPVVGAAVALVAGYFGARMIRLDWIRRADPGLGPCRSVGWHGLGLSIISLTGLLAPLAMLGGMSEQTLASWVAAGLTGATACFLPALLTLPGAAVGLAARARRALDGVSLGICLMFTSWVLVIAPQGHIDSLGFWIAMLTCCTVSIAAITVLRPTPGRRPVALCAAGVCLAVVGLDGLAFCLANGYLIGWPSAFGVLLIGAAALIWLGVNRNLGPGDSCTGAADDAGGGAPLAAYPVLAVPAGIAIVVTLHRLVTGRSFDRATLLLGLLGAAAIVLRETLAARDVARFARQVTRQEVQFRSLIAGSADVIMILDGDLVVRWQSAAAARQFGLSDQEVVGRHFQSMVHPEDAIVVAQRLADVRAGYGGHDGDAPVLVEARLRDGFGSWRETESAISDQRANSAVSGMVIHIRDIGERKEMERTVHRLAYADALTGLANRRQMLMSIVAQRCSPRAQGSLLLVELDGFNAINDVRGYDIGDAVLVEVARRLRAAAGEGDLPARLSGDEFAVVTQASSVQAYALATRLLTLLAEPVQLPGVTVHLSASIGISDLASASNGDDVLRRADLALRRAKQPGRGRVEWFDAAVEEVIVRRMTLEQELPEALRRGELDIVYQPILDLVQGRPTAVEALLRWRHPRLGTLLPGELIPVAEDLGLINDIGRWVLHQSSRQLATWLRERRDLSMAVNVSPRQLHNRGLVDEVAAVLAQHELPPDHLVLEVAETGIGDDGTAIEEAVAGLRKLGVRTALDEFGTGVASLTHLRTLPIDMVKIGRSFFDDALGGPLAVGQSVPLIDVMVGLGRRLGVDVAAQGLEARAHLAVVRGAGCRLGQGHLFARPQPAERTEAYLDGFPARSR